MTRPKLPPKRKKIISEQKKKVPTKDEMVSMRLTTTQLTLIDDFRQEVQKQLGLPVTRGWVMVRLMELGAPVFERVYGIEEPTDEL